MTRTPTSPKITPVPTCKETRQGYQVLRDGRKVEVKPYQFAETCVKCARGDLVEPFGAPKENDAFEAEKMEGADRGKKVLLCRKCATRAIKHYKGQGARK